MDHVGQIWAFWAIYKYIEKFIPKMRKIVGKNLHFYANI